ALRQSQTEYEALCDKFGTLELERRQLFGDADPDDVEKKLASEIVALESLLESSRKTHQEKVQNLELLRNKIESLDHSITERNDVLIAKTAAFCERIAVSGFESEADYVNAGLPEEIRRQSAEKDRQLKTAETELRTKRLEKASQLEAELAKRLTEQSCNALKREADAWQDRCNEVQRKIGAISQQLQQDEMHRQKKQGRIAEIERQESECRYWNTLYELIGSSDGKKYRNFVQGLTFETMIRYANRQLRKMTDRYLMTRSKNVPLELDIIDNDQAGEIRSTKNLSGGECFLVSLALALGLSQMSSQNVRVDSLFLDEGFGTLDEETLETALETLVGLRHHGKCVGVISHVPAVKERIGTQIQLIPQSGGRSGLQGPGCSHHSAKLSGGNR
ncbi:MAG: hypothetical protein FWC50_07200, partial [Planctomycetaceae bacterium]|nr:hypothetical protein [Planctomycetaceae bacterium]